MKTGHGSHTTLPSLMVIIQHISSMAGESGAVPGKCPTVGSLLKNKTEADKR